MSTSTLPDTDRHTVVLAAIAYDIIKKVFPENQDQSNEGIKKYLLKITSGYTKVYSAILTGKPLVIEDIKLD